MAAAERDGCVNDRVVLTGRITNGRLRVRGWKPFLALPNGEALITIEHARATRSLEANACYWAGYIAPLAEYTGYTPKEIHAYLKQRFLPPHLIVIVDRHTGEVVDQADVAHLTTTTLTPQEFSNYLHEIAGFAETLHVAVGANRDAA